MTLLFSRALSGDSTIISGLHFDHNIGVPNPPWMDCVKRMVFLGRQAAVLRVRQAIGEAGLNDGLTLAAGHMGLNDWLLVLRRRAADDQLAISLGTELGAPVLVRLLLILLALILTVRSSFRGVTMGPSLVVFLSARGLHMLGRGLPFLRS